MPRRTGVGSPGRTCGGRSPGARVEPALQRNRSVRRRRRIAARWPGHRPPGPGPGAGPDRAGRGSLTGQTPAIPGAGMTAVTATGKTERARENRAHLRRLLSEKQPELLAALQLAERQLDRELSGESP